MTDPAAAPPEPDDTPIDHASVSAKQAVVKEISEFFAAVGARAECPMCLQKRWEIISPHAIVLTHDGSGNRWSPKFEIPALAMTCMGCGFLRMHSSGMMKRIADAAGKPGIDP